MALLLKCWTMGKQRLSSWSPKYLMFWLGQKVESCNCRKCGKYKFPQRGRCSDNIGGACPRSLRANIQVLSGVVRVVGRGSESLGDGMGSCGIPPKKIPKVPGFVSWGYRGLPENTNGDNIPVMLGNISRSWERPILPLHMEHIVWPRLSWAFCCSTGRGLEFGLAF